MKASIYQNYGSPEVIQIEDVEKPIPKVNEMLIKVHAATVNRTDCANLTAKPFIMRFTMGLFKPKNQTLGTDFAGEIVSVGREVLSFNIGDRVFGFDDLGISSHAQYMTISQDNALAIIPDNISYEQAAASIEGAHYAINMLNKVHVQAGEKVMVNGASGAIGSAIVQLLKEYQVDVTATCRFEHIEEVRLLGANRVIDYLKDDFTQDSQQYNYVFDTVGKSTFGKCKRILVPEGVYISSELGPWSQNIFYSLLTPIFGKKKVKFPLPLNRQESVNTMKRLLDENKYHPLIDRIYSLDKVADAFRYVLTGQKKGNVVVNIDHHEK